MVIFRMEQAEVEVYQRESRPARIIRRPKVVNICV